MKNIGLVVYCCLLWTTVVNAQTGAPPVRMTGSPSVGRGSPHSLAIGPVSSVFAERNEGSYGFLTPSRPTSSTSAPITAAGYEEEQSAQWAPVQSAQYESSGTQSWAQAPTSGLDALNSEAPYSEWIDVSGLDLFGVMPYYSHLQYGDGSVKDSGNVFGFYGYASTTFDLVEVGIESTTIDFRSGFRFQQQDYTAVWNNYSTKNLRMRAGFHYMSSNSATTDGGLIGIFGAHLYKDRWEAGTDFYVSHYQDFAPALTVLELSPRVAFPVGLSNGEVRGYYIHSNIDLGLGKRDFLSLEGRVSQDIGKFNVGAYGWGGEQTFAVRNNGFVVFNLTEKHRAGYGGEVNYKFTEHTKLTGRISQELFSDFNTLAKTQQSVLSVLLLHTF